MIDIWKNKSKDSLKPASRVKPGRTGYTLFAEFHVDFHIAEARTSGNLFNFSKTKTNSKSIVFLPG